MKKFLQLIILIHSVLNCFTQSLDCQNIDSILCYTNIKYNTSELMLEKKFQSIDDILVPHTPLLADMNGDCIPELIFQSPNNKDVLIIDTRKGSLITIIYTPILNYYSSDLSLCVGDIDKDGIPEIFLELAEDNQNPIALRGRLICYNMDNSVRWISDQKVSSFNNKIGGAPALADFNQDGIPEVYLSNKIFNSESGVMLADGGNNGIGTQLNPLKPVSIAGHLDNDTTDLELAAGYTIYKVEITNTTGMTGNRMVPYNIRVDNSYRDGYTILADIDQDDKLEVIVYSQKTNIYNSLLYIYNLSNGSTRLLTKAYTIDNELCGMPVVGYIEKTSFPSILIATKLKLLHYAYDGSSLLKLNWTFPTTDGSSNTGLTLFDFNNDGTSEIVYRDMTSLKLIDGSTNSPKLIDSIICYSPTWAEYPIVGDFDNSGHAQICIPCANSANDNLGKLTIFGPPDSLPGWAPARKVWNQYNYHVLNINDDLTVPRIQKNNATYKKGKYNNFLVQESLLDENGMYQKKAASLFGNIRCINYNPANAIYTVFFDVINRADASNPADSGLAISFYNGDPAMGGSLLGTYYTSKNIAAGDSLINLVFGVAAIGLNEVYMVVNSSRKQLGNADSEDYDQDECDYTDNISRTIELPEIDSLQAVICEGSTYPYYGKDISEAGRYYHIQYNAQGCDSIISILELNTTDSVKVYQKISACDDFEWNGRRYDQSGDYRHDTLTQAGCDSVTILELTVNKSNSQIIKHTACDSFNWNREKYDKNGYYKYNGTNRYGCDSIIILELKVNNSDQTTIQQESCNEFIWNGRSYTQSGIYRLDTINIYGCDSLVTLTLEIKSVLETTIQETGCDSILWNGKTYRQSGNYKHQTKSHQGCDSLVNLELKINYSGQSDTTVTQCDGFSWNGVMYDQSGLYTHKTLTNQSCDSSARLQLIIHKSSTSTQQVVACDEYRWNGIEYNQSGNYTAVLQNTYGCDSISKLELTIHRSDTDQIKQRACDNFTWNGKTYDQSGHYVYKSKNQNGCDSMVHLELTLYPSSTRELRMSVCDSLIFSGQVLNQPGRYNFVFQDHQGCDSIINLELSILSVSTINRQTKCDSFYWPVNGISYGQSGLYTAKYINRHGCDSIELLELKINPSYHQELQVEACKEYLWEASKSVLKQSGNYLVSLQTVEGCDSVIGLWLLIHEQFENTDTVISNKSYKWPVNGQTYETTGLYQQEYKTAIGCDSIYRLVLIIKDDKDIYAPNVISPASINQKFTLYDNGHTIEQIRSLSIYDRWGNQLWIKTGFQANNINEGWDGRSDGKSVIPGVYIWYAQLKLTDGSVKLVHGDVTVVN